MGKFIDYYTLLNILPTASEELIKRAYRIQSKEVHPDQGGNEQQFILLTEAYDVLSDPSSRKAYDQDYAYYQQTQQRTKEQPEEEREKTKPKDESNSKKAYSKFSFDYVRYGKVMLGALISLSILAKAISAFEDSNEPEIPDNPIVFPVAVNEQSEEVPEDIQGAEYELDKIEKVDVEPEGTSIDMIIESEIPEDVIQGYEQSKRELTATTTNSITDSSSLYVRYLDRIYKLDVESQNYGQVWETGSDAEITQATYMHFEAWDDLLSEIYQSLKLEMTDADFSKLRDTQRTWLVERDRVADAAVVDFIGGSWETPLYTLAQMEETRKRCLWLVMNYMN